jgi:hypothetical protein
VQLRKKRMRNFFTLDDNFLIAPLIIISLSWRVFTRAGKISILKCPRDNLSFSFIPSESLSSFSLSGLISFNLALTVFSDLKLSG